MNDPFSVGIYLITFFFQMGIKIKHKVAWHDNNGRRNCQPKYCQSELIKSKQRSMSPLLINHKKLGEEYGAFWWVGFVYSNYEWWQYKIQRKDRNYHFLSAAAFAWIWRCGCEEVVFVIIHSWQTIINADRVVYNKSCEFSVPEDELSQGTSQGERGSRWRSLYDKHPTLHLM